MSDPIDPLRLSFCPACGYALDGLPTAGRCPECGGAYDADRQVVVLQAWRTGEAARLAAFAVLAVALGARLVATSFRPSPIVYLEVAVLAAVGAVEWFTRSSITGPSPLLLWLTPDGVGVSSTVPPDSIVRRVRRALPWATGAAAVVWLCSRPVHEAVRFAVLVLAAIAAVGLVRRSSGPTAVPPTLPPPAPVGPPLWSWSTVTQVTLTPVRRRPGRHRFTANRKTMSGTVRLARVDLELSPTVAAALARRVEACRRSS